MKSWKMIMEEMEPVYEVVGRKMIGVAELFTDDDFLEWVEKQPDSLMNKKMYDIYQLYLKQK